MKLSTFKTFSAPVINYETIGYELIKAAEIRCWVCHIHKKIKNIVHYILGAKISNGW